jgi:predicted nucleotidyltransferase
MASPALIQRAGEALAEAAGSSAKVILFGSHARGEAQVDSDVDFLVIEPALEDRFGETVRLGKLVGELGVPADVIVIDEALAARRAKVPGTMVYHAMRDGRVITPVS